MVIPEQNDAFQLECDLVATLLGGCQKNNLRLIASLLQDQIWLMHAKNTNNALKNQITRTN